MLCVLNMSRIGKMPITIPQGVTVEINNGGNYGFKEVIVKGPKGELKESLKRGVDAKIEENTILVTRDSDSKQDRAFHGLFRTLINNMVDGVTKGYSKSLEIVGIGYRAEMQGANLILSVGYSHKINYEPPVGITITVQDQTNVTVNGANKQVVGEVASKIRGFRKPEPYKGKGVRYKGEVVRRKSTKAGA